MILHKEDGTQIFSVVSGSVPCVKATAVTFTAADIEAMLAMEPEHLHEWLGTGPGCRFGPYITYEDLKAQWRSVKTHNATLDTAEEHF